MPVRKQDYHAVLGLTSDASDDAIRAAYKKLALQWHPDRHLVGKERAAQRFIEVNEAYHALMDGKESTHSSSAETSSTTSAPTGSSTDPAPSDTQPKSSQGSSRPPSASSNSSKQSKSHSSESSSTPTDDHGTNTSKSSTRSGASPFTPSSSRAPSPDNMKSSSHSKPAEPSSDRNQPGRRSKSHDHLRDPPRSAAGKTTAPASTQGHSAEGRGGSTCSKSSEKATNPSQPKPERKHDSHSEKTNRTSGSGRSRASKPVIPPPSGRLHKLPRFGFADDFVHKLSKGTTESKAESPHSLPQDQDATPYGLPLRAINTPQGHSREWIFPLPLTLDEMYHGTTYRFLVTRELLSHRTEQVEISIDIPAGMRSGTRIVCPRTGHQRKDGTLQDVVFLVEEVPDERFSRVKDDLFMDVCVPWADPLADQGGEISIHGVDGKMITFTLPYPIYDKATEGQVLVKGAGMPIREGRKTIGRGDMIVRWRVVFAAHQSKWQTLKRALHLDV